MKIDELVPILKKLAEDKYNEHYDTFVECYGDEEWERLIVSCDGSLERCKDLMARLASVWEAEYTNARIERESWGPAEW